MRQMRHALLSRSLIFQIRTDDEDKDGEAKIDLILLEIGQFVR